MVVLNGQVVGLHSDPKNFVKELRFMRRRNKIDESTSISLNYDRRIISLDTDDGRICRPLIVVEHGKPLIQP